MAAIGRFPPGRAGRMWLRGRLATAERGSDQLSRKLRVLITEQERLHILQQTSHRDWSRAWTLAYQWQLRSGIVGGQEALRRAGSRDYADVQVLWSTAVGVRYPTDVQVIKPAGPAFSPPGNAAVVAAEHAFQAALVSAARVAAADDAVRRIDAEVALTRRRVRALEKQWVPSLHASLTRIEQSLEQAERDDAARLRRATKAPINGRSRP